MNKKILMDKKIILALLIVSIALIGISSVSAHDVNAIDVGDIISIENNTIDENNGNIHGEYIDNNITYNNVVYIHNGNIYGEYIDNNTSAYDDGAIYFRPANILTYVFVDELNSISIGDAPQNIDFSKCRNVTIFSKLSGLTSTVSVPEGYMIVIDENNLTIKHI